MPTPTPQTVERQWQPSWCASLDMSLVCTIKDVKPARKSGKRTHGVMRYEIMLVDHGHLHGHFHHGYRYACPVHVVFEQWLRLFMIAPEMLEARTETERSQ